MEIIARMAAENASAIGANLRDRMRALMDKHAGSRRARLGLGSASIWSRMQEQGAAPRAGRVVNCRGWAC